MAKLTALITSHQDFLDQEVRLQLNEAKDIMDEALALKEDVESKARAVCVREERMVASLASLTQFVSSTILSLPPGREEEGQEADRGVYSAALVSILLRVSSILSSHTPFQEEEEEMKEEPATPSFPRGSSLVLSFDSDEEDLQEEDFLLGKEEETEESKAPVLRISLDEEEEEGYRINVKKPTKKPTKKSDKKKGRQVPVVRVELFSTPSPEKESRRMHREHCNNEEEEAYEAKSSPAFLRETATSLNRQFRLDEDAFQDEEESRLMNSPLVSPTEKRKRRIASSVKKKQSREDWGRGNWLKSGGLSS
jgi:hypothetical protein